MVQTDTQSTFGSTDTQLTQDDSVVLSAIAGRLDTEPDALEIYEGSLSGTLYAAVSDGYQQASVAGGELQVTHVTDPEVDEELDPLARVEPDTGETVQDAVNNLSFAGD